MRAKNVLSMVACAIVWIAVNSVPAHSAEPVSTTASSLGPGTEQGGAADKTTANNSVATGESADKESPVEIVVTARKRSERLIDVPVAATSLSREELARYDTTTLAEIRSLVPQVRFDRGFTGAGASISMRGISSSNLDAGIEQSILVDVDGMPTSRGRILNDALFDLKSVEVLKGPQALFFGKNSPGGVVAIRTAEPTANFEADFHSGYEVVSRELSFEGAVSGPLTDKLTGRVAVVASNSDGYIKNNDPGIADPFRPGLFVPAAGRMLGAERRFGGRVTLAFDPTERLDMTLRVLATSYQGQGLQSFSEVMSCPPGHTHPVSGGVADPYGDCRLNNRVSTGTLPPDVAAGWPNMQDGHPSSYSRNVSVLPVLTMNYKLDRVTMTSVTGYYHYDYQSRATTDGTAYAYFFSSNPEKNSSFTQEIRAASSFSTPLNFAVGAFYEHDDRVFAVSSQNTRPIPADPATGKLYTFDAREANDGSAYSFFGQLIWKMLSNVELAGGARYSHETKHVNLGNTFVNPASAAILLPIATPITGKHSEDNVSPEATLTWHPSSNTTLYGAYKTGYLSGGFSNPGILSRSLTLQNDTFQPEKVRGGEVGAKWSLLGNRLGGDLVVFQYDYRGLPLSTFDAQSVTFVTRNAASTVTKGVEFQTHYDFGGGLSVHGGMSYDDARFKDFRNGQCYVGQTVADGCVPVTLGSAVRSQDLSGKRVYRAPDWLGNAGAQYQFPIAGDFEVGLTADVQYTSSYYANLNLNPGSLQGSFILVDASARITTPSGRWSVAVIGRNLTNEIYATLGTDKPGGVGEVMTVAGTPRAVLLQVSGKF